ncbi:MAG TPA: DNA polymerase III subunit delta [Clostridiaceae bacterium]|nr:DNA polymerase III subunit delta [Clostridiaceae bacterium]
MSYDVLRDELKKGVIRNLYLFYGEEEYLKEYCLKHIEESVVNENTRTLNKIVLEGKTDPEKIIDNCETMPVFSDKKIVIVKNSGLFMSKGKSEGKAEKKGKQQDELTLFLQNMPDYTYLIFYEEEIDKRIKLVNVINKHGLVVEFSYRKPSELAKWVIKVFKASKKEISAAAASMLVENCEAGMNSLLNEINKIISFMGDERKVTEEIIDKVCSKSVKGRIFDLTDAIAEKNSAKALELLNDLIVLKEPVPKILFMITRQLRQILEMKLLVNEGLSEKEAASKMNILPFVAGKLYKQAQRFTVDVLKDAINQSLEMDIAIKNGKLDGRIAAELFIAGFCR